MISRFSLAIVTLVAFGTSRGFAGPVNAQGEHSHGLWQINIAPSSTQQSKGSTMRPWTTTHAHSMRGSVRPTLTIRPSMGTFRLR